MQTNIDLSTIQYIFAKPHVEHYYLYGVNTVKQLNLIPKEQLVELISESLNCTDTDTMEFVFSRNMPFLFDNSTKKIKQFQYVNETPTREDVRKRMIDEMDKSMVQAQSPFQRQCDDILKNNGLFKRYRNLFSRQ